jgi:hypothetical protein
MHLHGVMVSLAQGHPYLTFKHVLHFCVYSYLVSVDAIRNIGNLYQQMLNTSFQAFVSHILQFKTKYFIEVFCIFCF